MEPKIRASLNTERVSIRLVALAPLSCAAALYRREPVLMTRAVHLPLLRAHSTNLGTRWITDERPRLERWADSAPAGELCPDQTVSILA